MNSADLIFRNGTIRTMNPDYPQAECVAVYEGKIVMAGSQQDCQHLQGETTRVIDLQGKTLLPGFSDNHLHMLGYGISLVFVNLMGFKSIEQVVSAVKEAAKTKETGKWILGRGWDQNEYSENRYFTRHDLDRGTSDHPVFMRRVCGHAAVANSKALELAGINKDTPDPVSGIIERDSDTGEPNGILHENAMDLVAAITPPLEFHELQTALKKAMEKAIQAGITSITTDDVGYANGLQACIDLYQSLWDEGIPTTRSYLLIAGKYLDEAIEKGYVTGWGSDQVKIGPLKLFQDGSLGARTAALGDPYSDQPDTRGLFIHPQESFNEVALRAQKAGMQIGVHAIGDAAISSTLEALEFAQKHAEREDCRHRIIHYEVINEEIIERTKKLGAIADIQPKFLTTDGAWLEKRLGPERSRYACAWKTILDSGIPAVGGSDCPVEPLEPLLGLHAAVTRTVYSNPGESWMPQEKLSVEEAVALFTRDGAYGSFEEDRKGMIKEGYFADLVVLGDDPWTVNPDNIDRIPVELTMIAGKICFSSM